MILKLSTLSPGESRFTLGSDKEPRVSALVAELATEGCPTEGPFTAELRLTKLEPEYVLRGEIACRVRVLCDRCAEQFGLPITHRFELALARAKDKRAATGGDEEAEQLDFVPLTGDELDLVPLLKEQFFLSLPYGSLCRPDCRGICQGCGQNLNEGTCQCKAKDKASAFAGLEQLKL